MYLAVLFSAAIPIVLKPYSIADIILILLSPMSFIFVRHNRIVFLFIMSVWLLLCTYIAELRGINISYITALSIVVKFAGAITLYEIMHSSVISIDTFKYNIAVIIILVLLSLFFQFKPLPNDYYEGVNGVFQASADAGFFLITFLGVAIEFIKSKNSIRWWIFIYMLIIASIIFSDSRFAFIIALLFTIWQLFNYKKNIWTRCGAFIILFISIIFVYGSGEIYLPGKIANLIYSEISFISLLNTDASLAIRIENFAGAIEMSDWITIIFGNGAKFFPLNVKNLYFDENYSLDNSWIYYFLSFGVFGVAMLCLLIFSKNGFGIYKYKSFSLLVFLFTNIQDSISNSYGLIILSIAAFSLKLIPKHN
jgi:hypothetical protein